MSRSNKISNTLNQTDYNQSSMWCDYQWNLKNHDMQDHTNLVIKIKKLEYINRVKIWPERWQKLMVQPCLCREQKGLLWPSHCAGCWWPNRLSKTAVAGFGECQADNQRLYQQYLQSHQPQILYPNCLQETLARNPLYPFYFSQWMTEVILFNKETTFYVWNLS